MDAEKALVAEHSLTEAAKQSTAKAQEQIKYLEEKVEGMKEMQESISKSQAAMAGVKKAYDFEKSKCEILATKGEEQTAKLASLRKEMEVRSEEAFAMEDVKKMVARAQAIEQTKDQKIGELLDEIADLQNSLDKVEVVNEYIGHMNQNQKIKYVLRLKQENNSLKRELAKKCNEMSKLANHTPGNRDKEVKALSSELARYRSEYEEKSVSMKLSLKNT